MPNQENSDTGRPVKDENRESPSTQPVDGERDRTAAQAFVQSDARGSGTDARPTPDMRRTLHDDRLDDHT
jgi:hypothetical protein